MRRLLPLALLPVLVLAGCSGVGDPASSSSSSSASSASAASGAVRVVASTDVWGDIAEQVGGEDVSVDSIITDPDRDPHEYQADPRDQLAVSRAQLVILNGGGYDDFLQRLVANAPSGTKTLDMADESGIPKPTSGEFNEHIWYDLPAVSKLAGVIEAELARLAPEHRSAFAARLHAFQAAVAELEDQESSIRTTAQGKGVAITEPVPLYMTTALGLVNRTPPAFSEAIEEGDDVAPSVLRQQLALFSGHRVAVLAYNEQTTGSTTEQVLDAAKSASIPVVGVRETLPDGQGYLAWMRSDLDAFRAALAR